MSNNNTQSDYAIDALSFGVGKDWIPIAVLLGTTVGAILLHFICYLITKRIAATTGYHFDNELLKYCTKPTFFMFPLAGLLIVLQLIKGIDQRIVSLINQVLLILLILSSTWTALMFVKAASSAITKDNEYLKDGKHTKSRRLATQLVVVTRTAYGLIIVMGVAGIFLTFPGALEYGVTLFASASVSALLIGLAAKPVLENLIASIQIAMTQPILLDDFVCVDGYKGTVEEIQAQYFVIKTGDDSRVIIPLLRVVNTSFENYSRDDEFVTVGFLLYVDYGVPLEDLRKQFHKLVQQQEIWDRRDASLTIDEAKENCLVLRASMTAAFISDGDKLKNEIREQMIEYLVTVHPQYLPRARSENINPRTGVDSMRKVVARMDGPMLNPDPEKIG